MATITLTDWTWYKDSSVVSSYVIGKETAPTSTTGKRIARFKFTAPAEGATHINFSWYVGELGAGSAVPLNFYIGTDATSHINAGVNAEYTGTITQTKSGSLYTFTGEADVVLLPNETYYLWFFPATTAYGYFSAYGGNSTKRWMETSGEVGTTYTLSISEGTGSTITVNRNNTSLKDGAIIIDGESLTIIFGAEEGYALNKHTVNGETFVSGDTYTVTGDVSVESTAMATEYQYVGRSNAMVCPSTWEYYVLMYAKAQYNETTNQYTVSVKLRMACTVASDFYGWATSGEVKINNAVAFSWSNEAYPNTEWEDSYLTVGGYTYSRWVDMLETSALVDAPIYDKEIALSSTWIMENGDGSSWLPEDGTTATNTGSILVAGKSVGFIYIDNGSGWDIYQVYIDNGTSWDLYIPYIDNGTGWDMYG